MKLLQLLMYGNFPSKGLSEYKPFASETVNLGNISSRIKQRL